MCSSGTYSRIESSSRYARSSAAVDRWMVGKLHGVKVTQFANGLASDCLIVFGRRTKRKISEKSRSQESKPHSAIVAQLTWFDSGGHRTPWHNLRKLLFQMYPLRNSTYLTSHFPPLEVKKFSDLFSPRTMCDLFCAINNERGSSQPLLRETSGKFLPCRLFRRNFVVYQFAGGVMNWMTRLQISTRSRSYLPWPTRFWESIFAFASPLNTIGSAIANDFG